MSEFNDADINNGINPDELKDWSLDQKSNESLSLPDLNINYGDDSAAQIGNNEINPDELEKWFSPSKSNEKLLPENLDADYEDDSVEELENIANNIGNALQPKENDENLELLSIVDKAQENILIIEMLLDNNLLVTPDKLGEIIDQFVSLIGQIEKINVESGYNFEYKEGVFLYQKDEGRLHRNYLEMIICSLSKRLQDVLRYNKDDNYFNLIKERKADILKIYNSFRSYEDIIVSLGRMRSHYRQGIGEACESFIPFFEQPNNFTDVQSLSEAARKKFQDGLPDCYNKITERKQIGESLTPFERMSKYVHMQLCCLSDENDYRRFSFIYPDAKDLLPEFIDMVISDFNECKDSDDFEFWVFINDKYDVEKFLNDIIKAYSQQNDDANSQTLQNLKSLESEVKNVNFEYEDLVTHFSGNGYIGNLIKKSGCRSTLEILSKLEDLDYDAWNKYEFYCENQIDYIEAQIDFLENQIRENKLINASRYRYYGVMGNEDWSDLGLKESDVESLQTFDSFCSQISFINYFEDTIKKLFYQYRDLAFYLKSKIDSPEISEQEKQNLENKYRRAIKNRAQIYDVACRLAGVKQDLLKDTYIKIQNKKFQKLSGFQKSVRIALLIITIPIHVPIFILKKTLFKFIGCSLLGLEAVFRFTTLLRVFVFWLKNKIKINKKVTKMEFKDIFEFGDCKDAWAKINDSPVPLEGIKINGEEIGKRIKWYETKNWLLVRRILFPIDFAVHVFIGVFLAIKKFFKSIIQAVVNIIEIIKDIYSDDPCSHIFSAKNSRGDSIEVIVNMEDKLTVVPKHTNNKVKIKNKFTDTTDPVKIYLNILGQLKSFWNHLKVIFGFGKIAPISEYDKYMHHRSGIQRYDLIPDKYYKSKPEQPKLETEREIAEGFQNKDSQNAGKIILEDDCDKSKPEQPKLETKQEIAEGSQNKDSQNDGKIILENDCDKSKPEQPKLETKQNSQDHRGIINGADDGIK